MNIIEILIEAQTTVYDGDPTTRQRTIDISNCGVSVTDFDIKLTLDDLTYMQLVEAGELGTREYLASYRSPQAKSEIHHISSNT
ncbi:hypothetical protein KFU94_25760 [Chloroflexi bacterium TSY]|nr:hypothetical protein [Chloroflexi bacterium TSY]